MEEKNFFAKMIDKLKLNKNANKSTVFRRIASLALASTITLATLGLTACDIAGITNNSSGGTTNSGTPSSDTPTSKYSKILTDILNSDYYDKIVEDFKKSGSSYTNIIHAPVPYYFLERQGHDINSIKDGTLECESIAYIKGDNTNKLYLSTLVENDAPTPYYTDYVLSYSLTDQEYDDLYMLHDRETIYSGLFIQELSRQKTTKVESKVNITVDTYKKMVNTYNKVAILEAGTIRKGDMEIDIINVTDANHFEIVIRSEPSSNNMIISNCELRNLKIELGDLAFPKYENDIFHIEDPGAGNTVNLEEYQNNYETITYFDSQNAYNVGWFTESSKL